MKKKYQKKINRQLDIIHVLYDLTYYDEEDRDIAFEDYKKALKKINVYHDGYTEMMQDPYWDYEMKTDIKAMSYGELSNLVNEMMHKSDSDLELFLWLYDHHKLHDIYKLMIEQKWEKVTTWRGKSLPTFLLKNQPTLEEKIERMPLERKWHFISQTIGLYQMDKEICERLKDKDPAAYRSRKHSKNRIRKQILFCFDCMEDAFCPIGRRVVIQNEEEDYVGVCTYYSSGKIKVVPEEEFSMESFTIRERNYAWEYDYQPLRDSNCFLDQDERYEFAGF